MLSRDESVQALAGLFRRQPVADLSTLLATLETRSRMSVFRRLALVGYLSSCSHAGRYYTRRDIPQFDQDGLWFHQGVLFSRHGTLKSTVERLVEVADDGRTHPELQLRLCVRVQNTLLDLVQEQRLGREALGRQYLYVSRDPARSAAQVARRHEPAGRRARSPEPLATSAVVEILLEVIHTARATLDATSIAARLRAAGRSVLVEQVQEVFDRYGLVKKTARSRSRRSQR